MTKNIHKILFFLFLFQPLLAQKKNHEQQINEIFNLALTQGKSYDWLDYLSNQIGGRLSGSLNAERAVKWGEEALQSLDLDRVYLEDVMVPKWVRGNFEYASIITGPGMSINVPVCSLGGSIATPAAGLRAQVVEVKDFEELEALGEENIKGKFVFYNRDIATNEFQLIPFNALGELSNYRWQNLIYSRTWDPYNLDVNVKPDAYGSFATDYYRQPR